MTIPASTATALASAHAAARFGFGPRPGELAGIGGDPRGWLREQLGRTVTPLEVDPAAARIGSYFAMQRQRDPDQEQRFKVETRRRFRQDAGARTRLAVTTDAPLLERLVHFWANHFTVSIARPIVAPVALQFEAEAIRPHVLGRFADMLLAVVRHPAMLIYLDNALSVGPDSLAGRRRERGLNENLAREVLELHTLGVDGGYTQADVTQFAAILTGWTVARRGPEGGRSRFEPRIHQPGDKVLLGKRYAEAGVAEGEAALRDLAAHPATARHLATKLARHFIADEPPAAAVEALAAAYRDSGGDLKTVTETLIGLDAAWAAPLAKVRTPTELVVAALRAVGSDGVADDRLLGSLQLLGQVPYMAPSPAGWPDRAADWLGPEAAMRRIDWALAFAGRMGARVDARALVEASLGGLAPADLQLAVARAPSPQEGLALLLASPTFQRR